jgi:hypothetical protein
MEIELTSGMPITLKPINLILLERFDRDHTAPTPPQREAEVIGGGVELVDDEEDEDYLEELSEFNRTSMWDLLNLIAIYGTDVELPEDDDWIDELVLAGITVDETSESRMKIDYVQMVMMNDLVEDLKRMIYNVFLLSGVEEDAINQQMDMFQR